MFIGVGFEGVIFSITHGSKLSLTALFSVADLEIDYGKKEGYFTQKMIIVTAPLYFKGL